MDNNYSMVTAKTKDPESSFGQWLREKRLGRGWSAHRLAEEIASATPVIFNLEAGKRNPSQEMIKRIADALSIDPLEGYVAAFIPGDNTRKTMMDMVRAGILDMDAPERKQLVEFARFIYQQKYPVKDDPLTSLAEKERYVLSMMRKNQEYEDAIVSVAHAIKLSKEAPDAYPLERGDPHLA